MTPPIRVLVVDDDFRVAGLHRDVVASHAGFTALDPVHSLGGARQAVRTHAPDLLLVDAFLPDGDGVEFVAAVDVDAFVLSAATDAATVRRALRAGALAYLTKPFDARILAERLDRYARMRNLLTTDRPLEQEQIDRALTILHGSADATSVSRTATEQVILEGLGDGEASAAEVAERVGISRATAQRHLAALASRGQVEVRLRYGSTGRPEHRYAATRR
jgi:two-component system CitB family response regulator